MNRIIKGIIRYIIIGIFLILALFPFYCMVITSFKPPSEWISRRTLFPAKPTMDNYIFLISPGAAYLTLYPMSESIYKPLINNGISVDFIPLDRLHRFYYF